jgi:ParB-like nuclease domain
MNQNPIDIPVLNLEFDYENPRLPTTRRGGNAEDVLRYMITEGKVTDLMQSIAEQGYFGGEPLLGIQGVKGKYTIVEGNRRLAALKLLNNPSVAPTKRNTVQEIVEEAKEIPKSVPVIIYKKRDDVLEYLGYRHITGVDDWDPLAKARYLKQVAQKHLKTPFDERLRILAKLIGSKADYVKKLLLGYALYEEIRDNDFYDIPHLDEESLEFSLLTTAVSYKNIADFIGMNEDAFNGNLKGIKKQHLEKITHWIFNKNEEGFTRVGESRNLKILSAVVASPKALKEFDGGKALEVARLYTSEPAETFSELVSVSLARIRDARELLYLVDSPSSSTIDNLKELQGIARNCIADLQSKNLKDDEG